MRVVRAPSGTVTVDPTGKAPGRGAYVCSDPACQAAAVAKGSLRRALEIAIPAGLFGVAGDVDSPGPLAGPRRDVPADPP